MAKSKYLAISIVDRSVRMNISLSKQEIYANVPHFSVVDKWITSHHAGDRYKRMLLAVRTKIALGPKTPPTELLNDQAYVTERILNDTTVYRGKKIAALQPSGKPNAPYIYESANGTIYELIRQTYVCSRCGNVVWSTFRHKGSQFCSVMLAKRIAKDSGLERTYYPEIYNAAKAAGKNVRMIIERAIYLVPTGAKEVAKVYFRSDLKDTMSLSEYMDSALSISEPNTTNE